MRFLIPLFLIAAVPAQAAEPCGGLAVDRGTVAVGQPLPATTSLDAGVKACLAAVAKDIGSRPALRTVTVSVRMPDADRLEGKGLTIANAYAEALAAAGVPRSRLSVVAPAANGGESASVAIAYTEKQSNQPIALAESVGGTVLAGQSEGSLAPIRGGAMLASKTLVQTKNDGRLTLGLADGSRLRLAERSMLSLGSLHLNEDLRRVVDLDLMSGKIEAHVAPGGEGSSFTVKTRTGVAGVRGTNFRVVADSDGTRVETLSGLVELTAPGGEAVEIPAGKKASINTDGTASAATDMLAAPQLTAPLKGDWALDKSLTWRRVRDANLYRVDLARDAEFTLDLITMTALKTKADLPETLGSGKWFWRVTPQDREGNDGLPSRVYAFVLAPK